MQGNHFSTPETLLLILMQFQITSIFSIRTGVPFLVCEMYSVANLLFIIIVFVAYALGSLHFVIVSSPALSTVSAFFVCYNSISSGYHLIKYLGIMFILLEP